MRIQHNIAAMNSYRNFSANNSSLNKNLEKLSTGYKINRAGDDAAGLAISEKMRAQISGLEGATKNAKDGISLVQTAEGALTEVHDMLNRMTTLAEQSANGTYQDELDREQLQKEVSQLKSEIDRIADSTNFNGLKLLDGSLTESKQAVEIAAGTSINSKENGIDMTDGVTINAPTAGAGNKQTYTMEFKDGTLFGAGDKLTFNIKTNATSAVDDRDVEYNASPSNLQFNGDSLKDQLDNVVKALNFQDTTATLGDNTNGIAYNAGYTASVERNATDDGYNLVLTANDSGGDIDFSVDSVTITDAQAKSTCTASTAGAAGTVTAGTNQGWNLFGGASASNPMYVNSGDTLTFEFDINGTTMYASITEGEDFFLETSDSVEDKTKKIAAALSNAYFTNYKAGDQVVAAGKDTSGAAFSAITVGAAAAPGSGGMHETPTIDESTMKVGDYVTLTANKATADGTTNSYGTIHAAQADADNGKVNVGAAYLTNKNGSTTKVAAVSTGTAGAVADDAAEVNTIDLAQGATNMSVGEKFQVNGTLRDGRSFSIELSTVKAGTAAADLKENQFAIGANLNDTATNIRNALGSAKNTVTITNADGTTEELEASKLFGATGEFTVGGNGSNITLTNNYKGAAGTTGVAGKIDNDKTGIDAGDKITTELKNPYEGADMSAAENLITFDASKIEQGTTLEIDGKTYEFVTDASYTTKSDNVAVVVDGLGDSATEEDIANALVGAMEGDTAGVYTAANGGDYNMTVSGNKLTISSADTGEGVEALSIKMGENKATTVLNVATTDAGTVENPDKVELNVKVGDTVKIGSKTYEFTAGKGTQNVDNVAVSLLDDNGDMMTKAADVAQRLADVVNAEAGDGSETEAGIVARATSDGKVVLTGKYDALAAKNGTDPYAAPNIAFAGGSRKLTLQIGDTADSYNQLSVEISDMHSAGLGIGDVDVSSQESAAAALDKIKEAVNRVSDTRGTLGALQNRLDHTINNLGVMRENIQNAESQIRDTDVAEEMMAYTKNNILNQSAQAMLAQANQLPQGVLQLLG